MARKKKKIPTRETYAILVDGETESWYFQMLKRNEKSLLINIEPKIPQKKALNEQFEKVCDYADYYTKVFWIIDIDKIIQESKVNKKGIENKIQSLKRYIDKITKDFNNVTIILNNPCLEFWFLLHFQDTTKYYKYCKNAEKTLKKYLKDYEKSKKYFTKQNNDIYLKLKPYLSNALKNTKKTQRTNPIDFEKAICEMNLFFCTSKITNQINFIASSDICSKNKTN